MAKINDELSNILKSRIDDTAEALQKMLPEFDMMPKQDDAEIKQAMLNISPDGMRLLYQRFGYQQVTDFMQEFSRNRRW